MDGLQLVLTPEQDNIEWMTLNKILVQYTQLTLFMLAPFYQSNKICNSYQSCQILSSQV